MHVSLWKFVHSLNQLCDQDAMTDNHNAEADAIDRAVSALEELFDVFIIAYADSSEEVEQCTMYVNTFMYVCIVRIACIYMYSLLYV